MRLTLVLVLALFLAGCGPGVFSTPAPGQELHVAAAANLAAIFDTLAAAEQKATGIRLIPSFGSTAQLTKQIESGAPFDILMAADNEHPLELASASLADAPQPYAVGRVVIWAPKHPEIRALEDLVRPEVRVVAIANPDLAPYGHASVAALNAAGLWARVQPKVVYAQNISAALSFVSSGNADVALTAFSLVAARAPNAPLVPANLHAPILQSLCVLKRTSQGPVARKAVAFLLGPEAQALLKKNGYAAP